MTGDKTPQRQEEQPSTSEEDGAGTLEPPVTPAISADGPREAKRRRRGKKTRTN